MDAPQPFHTVPNAAIARALREIADALDIEDENPFRVRAYRNAAQCLETLGQPVAELAARGGREALLEIPGVGESMAAKILEMLETGSLSQLRKVRREVPHELSALLGIEGLGPKKLHLLHAKLGVENLDDLERAVRGGDLLKLRGFGERSRNKLLAAIGQYRGRKGRILLPELIDLSDLQGDLQMHTDATDGRNTAEEMARAARAIGHKYIAITEHSQAVRVAGGLDDAGILERAAALRRLRIPGLRILAGVEVDIRRDGTLDLEPGTLDQLDVVVASVHSNLNLSREEMTRRVLRAIASGQVHILGHPTGRLLNEREPFEIDVKAVIESCVRHGVALEINAHPERLDLNDVHAKLARDLGAKLVISTDAHSTGELKLLRFGVGVARRAWLTRENVINTLPSGRLLKVLGQVH